ncbi:S4 domain protein [[Eubacterium] yurii subsp. margaretiae ATCC 43715]|nr:S4 domain protein [[Eubacterium] yurii subsp. margaretiae ATCC 43715]
MKGEYMRLDKYLKLTRIIKRRTVAKDAGESGIISVNGKVAKPSKEVNIGDIIEIQFPKSSYRVRVLDIKEHLKKEEAESMYEVLENESI